MDIVHDRLKCQSMADDGVVDDASGSHLCRPPSLALEWQRQGLGVLVLVEPALNTKEAMASLLLGMELMSSAMTYATSSRSLTPEFPPGVIVNSMISATKGTWYPGYRYSHK
jgi:hypothetical protein